MESKAVVPHRDVLNDIGPGLRTRLIVPPVNPLRFQLSEEALNNAVIPTVSFPAHAPKNPVGLQKAAEVLTRILNAVIGMINQSFLGPSSPDRHLKASQASR